MIIGITGKSGAGKGTVAKYLKQRGYVYHSLSDILRLELKKTGQEEDLPNLIKLGNRLRTDEGPGILGKRTVKLIKDNQEEKSLVDSIRNPSEIEEIRMAADHFILVAVDAPLEVRYQRINKRGRPGDNITFEAFKEQDFKQLKSDDTNAQQILDCFKQADYTVVNDSSLEELNQKVDNILKDLNLN